MSILVLVSLPLVACTAPSPASTAPIAAAPAVRQNHSALTAQLGHAGKYWNDEWKGRASRLYDEILAITKLYSRTHDYTFGESDCNDMAIDIWYDLASKGIASLIVVGNLAISREPFVQCNHAWVMVYSAEGAAAALDPSRGTVHVWEDTQEHPQLTQYWEGIVYEKPSDLWDDFRERW